MSVARRLGGRVSTAALAAWAVLAATVSPAAADFGDNPPPLTATQTTQLDAVARKALDAQHAPGISLTIARDGVTLYSKGFGYRDAAAKKPVDAGTIFPLGSVTKQFTAAAIEVLESQGKLSIDALLSTYLPDAPYASQITIRDLLRQTSGLAEYISDQPFFASLQNDGTAAPQAILAWAAAQPLAFPPGTHFAYSNTNYVVLGVLIEKLAGVPYNEFVQHHLAQLLGLATLTYGAPAAGDEALGYDVSGDAPRLVPPLPPPVSFAAGALYAAPADIVRWDSAVFGGGFGPSFLAEMTTPKPLTDGSPTSYAFGWISDTLDGRAELWHGGGVPGGRAENAWFSDKHIAVVVFANATGFDTTVVVRDAMRIVDPPPVAVLAAERAAELAPAAGENPAVTAAAKKAYAQWQHGTVDWSQYTATVREKIDPALTKSVQAALGASGDPTAFVFKGGRQRPGNDGAVYVYRVETPGRNYAVTIAFDARGKIAGIFFAPLP